MSKHFEKMVAASPQEKSDTLGGSDGTSEREPFRVQPPNIITEWVERRCSTSAIVMLKFTHLDSAAAR